MTKLNEFIKKISREDVVKEWVKDKSENSKKAYLYALADFCIINDVYPVEMIEIIQKDEMGRVPYKEWSVIKWFQNYVEFCQEKGRTKTTWENRRRLVTNFLNSSGIYISYYPLHDSEKREFKKNPIRNSLTKEDLKKVLNGCKSWKMRSLILVQASSGISSKHLIHLKVKDYKKGLVPLKDINDFKRVIGSFSLTRDDGEPFKTFISEETVVSIQNYLDLERVNPKPSEPLFTRSKNDKSPIHLATLQKAYRKLNARIGWKTEEKGSFRKATSRMMVNFFKSQMIDAGMKDDVRKYLMGLKTGEPKSLEEIRTTYFAYMEDITIEPYRMDEYDALKEENEKLNKEMAEIIDELDRAREEGIDLELIDYNKQHHEVFSTIQAVDHIKNKRIELYRKRIELLEFMVEKLSLELGDIKSKL